MNYRCMDRGFLILLGVLVALMLTAAALNFATHRYFDGAAQVCTAVAIAVFPILRRVWLTVGYRQGRGSVFMSLAEANQRHLTWGEWLDAELERDAADLHLSRNRGGSDGAA